MVKTELDKLKILLPHWIEHNHSHESEFKKWAEIAGKEGENEVVALINKAVSCMSEADHALEKALEKLGGGQHGEHHQHYD